MSTWLIAKGLFSPGMESSGSRADKHPGPLAECRDSPVEELGKGGQGKKMGCVTFPREKGGASDPFNCKRQVLFFSPEIVF